MRRLVRGAALVAVLTASFVVNPRPTQVVAQQTNKADDATATSATKTPKPRAATKDPAVGSGEMAVVKPESEGFSSERLENLHRLIQGEIDDKKLAGAITIL